MAKKKHSSVHENVLTAEDLRRYEAGEMTFQEMHRVEKILLEQPFYADAAEGVSKLKKDKVSTETNLTDLKRRLGKRLEQPSSKPVASFNSIRIWKPISIAAAVFLVFGGIYYLLESNQKEDTTALMAVEKLEPLDNLSESAASAPIAEEDNTAFNKKQESLPPKVPEKRSAVTTNQTAQEVVKQELATAVIDAPQVKHSAYTKDAEKLAEAPPQVVAAPVAMPIEEKQMADKDLTYSDTMAASGAARMARAAISGIVVNADNEPMKDVTVNIKGKADGTKTDEEGKFSLKDARRGDIVIFNSLTMPQMEVPLKNNLPGKIVYSEHNIYMSIKPKVSVTSPSEVMFEKTVTDAKPEFGWEAYEVYLKENTKLPPRARQYNVKGRVIVSFVVNEKSELSDFTIIRSLGFGCDEEAIRIIKNGPKWFPATKDDKPVSKSTQVVVKFQ